MTADLPALIARLEAAEVGSRELDGAVARLFGWHRVEPRFSRNKHGGWIAPEDFIGLYSDGAPKLDSLHGTDIHRDPPRLTQSLDAALALAERVLEGWSWQVQQMVDEDERTFIASLAPREWAYYEAADDQGGLSRAGNTPALAFCIAVLRAKQGEGG